MRQGKEKPAISTSKPARPPSAPRTGSTGQPTSQTDAFATYATRGLAVQFTTPALCAARARLAYKQFEFVLPSLSGGLGYYIMPWKAIVDSLAVTLHDRVLYELMVQHQADTPMKMRQVTLMAAARGLAGPEARDHAAGQLQAEREYQVITNFLLVFALFERVGLPPQQLFFDGLASTTSQKTLRSAISDIASRLRIGADELYSRLELLSTVIAPVGLRQAPDAGRMRKLVLGLASFAETVRTWSLAMPPEITELSRHEAAVADQTRIIAGTILKQIDQASNDVLEITGQWEKSVAGLSRLIGRLSWLLDGWELLFAMCNTTTRQDRADRQALITEMFNWVPVLPREEAEPGEADRVASLNTVQRRWVRANQDWRTGSLDYEQVARYESVKAQSL